MNTVKSTSLRYQNGSSDKFYNIAIQEVDGGYIVPFTYGRTGTAGSSGDKVKGVPSTIEKAKKAYDSVIKQKMAKGYKPEGDGEVQAGITVNKVDTGIYPQLLCPIHEDEVEKYLQDDRYGAQEKKDGRRKFLKHGNDNTVSINRKGQEVGYPKVFREACVAMVEFGTDKFLIDGEEVGDTLYAFDLLCVNDEVLYDTPFKDRFETLTKYVLQNGPIKVVPLAVGYAAKKALYDKLKKDGKEGIVFKLLDAPYVEGRPTKDAVPYSLLSPQVKHKFYSTATCIVIRENDKRSIGMGVLEDGKVIDVGNCTIPPNKDIPAVDSLVEIRYLYAYKGGSLYQPTYLMPRDDIEKADCSISQLKYKAEE